MLSAVRDALEAGNDSALSVDRLAETASVHRSTIYRRWATTDALVAELLRSLTPVETPIPDTGTLATDLLSLARRVARTITSPLVESTLRLAAASADPDLVDAARNYWSSVLERNAIIVERAQARGDATKEIAPIDAVEVLLAPIYFRLLVARRSIKPAEVDGIAEQTARMLAP